MQLEDQFLVSLPPTLCGTLRGTLRVRGCDSAAVFKLLFFRALVSASNRLVLLAHDFM